MRGGWTRRAARLALLGLVLAPATAVAQEPPPPADPPKPFTLPPVERYGLENGLDVRLVRYGDVPKVTARLVVQTGNVDEAPDEVWLANLTGALMEQGTTSRPPERIASDLAGMGGSLSLTVGVNEVAMEGSVLSEFAPALVELLADVARDPALPPAQLPRVRADLVRGLAIARTEAPSLARATFLEALYPAHPYGRVLPSSEQVGRHTIDDVRAFYARSFGAARARLYVVGAFGEPEVRSAVARAFAGWERGGTPTPVALSPSTRRAVYLVDRPGAVQSTISIGLPTVPVGDADHLPLLVTNMLLGGYRSSRITNNIREQKGYTYNPRSSIGTRLGTAFYVQVADVTTSATGASLGEILYEIRRLRAEPPTQDEVRGAQSFLAGSFVLDNSSRLGIVNQLAFLDLHGLGEDHLRTYVPRVLATTAVEIQEMARRHLDDERMPIVVVGDRVAVLEQVRPYGEIVDVSPTP